MLRTYTRINLHCNMESTVARSRLASVQIFPGRYAVIICSLGHSKVLLPNQLHTWPLVTTPFMSWYRCITADN